MCLFAKPTGLSKSGGLLGAQLGSQCCAMAGSRVSPPGRPSAGPVVTHLSAPSSMGEGFLRSAPGAAMPVGRGHADRALLGEVTGAASAMLTRNVPSPGARSMAMEAANPLRPGFGPISSGAWHHMVHALFVLPPLGKQGRGSLSAGGGGTQRGDEPASRGALPPSRHIADPQHLGAPTRSSLGTQRDTGGWEERVAEPDSSQRSCDSDAGFAQHQKVTARSSHPAAGAGALLPCTPASPLCARTPSRSPRCPSRAAVLSHCCSDSATEMGEGVRLLRASQAHPCKICIYIYIVPGP